MNAKRILHASLVLFALLALTIPAWAGGWAVATLDTLPTQVVAGQPFAIGFVVRQHGVRPMEGLTPKIILYSPDTRATVTLTAKAEGATGHYTAEVAFPGAGTWDWSIDAFGFAPQPMPRLTVRGSVPAANVGTSAAGARASLPTIIGFVALVAAAGALVLVIRTRAAWAAALTLVAALVCVVSFASAANHRAQAANSQPPSAGLGPGASEADLGRALFLAKGCVICHEHNAVRDERQAFAGFSVGPNLSKVLRSPDYVRVWLKDPPGLKPDTQMPNLGLSKDEIEALIAFLKPGASQ